MTQNIEKGVNAPHFDLPTNAGGQAKLADYTGRWLVLYFYPKDDTPGCTKEALAFTELSASFDLAGADILGISKDTPVKHDKFITKHDLNIRLASDEDGTICEAYGVWVEKNMYGRKYMGIERATFLISPDSKIEHVWRKVKVASHAEDVLATLKT
ncbi:MAG: thioredoxin-dependent thiol peroxidase [Hyphomonadaceae bacterium]